jgi:hypothetical protein
VSAHLDGELPLTRRYRVSAITWQRKPSTDVFRLRGRASLLILELGMVFHHVGIAIRSEDDVIVLSMPDRITPPQSALEPAVEFRGNRSHNIFARQAWAAVIDAFPDAETCAVSFRFTRPSTVGGSSEVTRCS